MLTFCLLVLTAPAAAQESDALPNVVILFADDLGYGDLSSYGHPTIRTPHLDRLAAEGMRLTSFYAQTWCVPSRAALLTGRHPLRIEAPYGAAPGADHGLSPDEVTLAEVLKTRGYRTQMIGKWHLGYARQEILPTGQGFDAWYGLPYSNDYMPPWVQTDVPLRLYRGTAADGAYPIPGDFDQDTLTTSYTAEAVRFIEQSAGEPFFLYLAYAMPHLPIHPAERFRGMSEAGLYGDVLATLDWSAGQIRDALEAAGVAENTIVIFTSDNGPWLSLPDRMLQGGNEPWHQGTTGPLRGDKRSAWEGGPRVPGIVWWPARIPAGQTSAALTTTMDLLPTLAEAAGAEVPTDRPLDGQSLWPLLSGEADTLAQARFFYSNNRRLIGVRDGCWKLMTANPNRDDTSAVAPMLFDLQADPGEQYNRAEREPAVVARLEALLDDFAAEVGTAPGGERAQARPETNPYIMVDQFGYRPQDAKVAVIADPQAGHNADDAFAPGARYEVRRWADGAVVHADSLTAWEDGRTDEQSGDRGWWFDFSAVADTGSFYVYDPERGVRSHRFTIRPDVYDEVLRQAMRVFFYQRVNFAKEPPYADPRWADGVAFGRDSQDVAARDVNNRTASTERDLRGGWFDAGDYNKYITFTYSIVSPLMTAYQLNPGAFGDDYNIPESGNGRPDLIDELKYELDWMKRMQDTTDGGVFIKNGSLDYDGVSPPSTDTRARFYEKKCSSSAIATAGAFAQAALIFREFADLQDYAADLTRRAEAAWEWYQTHERSAECDPQAIKAGDADWPLAQQSGVAAAAAAYLFAATEKPAYDAYVQEHYAETRPWRDGGDVFSAYERGQSDALLHYTTLDAADAATTRAILAKLSEQAASSPAYKDNISSLYRAYMPDPQYHWGSNAVSAGFGHSNVQAASFGADTAQVEALHTRALDHLHYLHGVNPRQRAYLSNMYEHGAERSVDEMYHRWFYDGTKWDNVQEDGIGPAPGYLVGGPNRNYDGRALPTSDDACAYPPMKCYADTNDDGTESWRITEPAMGYQSIYVLLLSHFASGDDVSPSAGR